MGLSNTVRPKHQVLILKCYPKFQKSTAEVKPNSSELSYLLYYASTRRTKLPKLGAYLEKRSESDVRHGRLGNVQVTLHILTAIIEKCSRDLALFAPFVLNILSMVLDSGDVNFVEESVPTFSAFCSHLDQATFAADPADLSHYEKIVATYAAIATKSTRFSGKGAASRPGLPEILRFRTAGLNAIKSLVSSDTFGSYGGEQLKVVMPAILDQLLTDDPKYLGKLQSREIANERHEKDAALMKRRQSIGARRSTDVPRLSELPATANADPAVATGTPADIDQAAREEVGVLALQSLKRIFETENRGQIRVATSLTLVYALARLSGRPGTAASANGVTIMDASIIEQRLPSTCDLIELICRFSSVQDRFVILVTAIENLISSPLEESDFLRQLVLVSAISRLLRSNINFIGLSVMDVLLGLIQHMLLLLHLSTKGHFYPGPRQSKSSLLAPVTTASSPTVATEKPPSAMRVRLVETIQQCVADLAMHVYYIDQVGDMLSALLLRLKPSTSSISSPVAAVENPEATVSAIADSVNLQEQPNADGFFSFDKARVIALQCVHDILTMANSPKRDNGSTDIRNRVGPSIWEGTQWILRDPDVHVRRAYIEALLAWLELEVEQKDLRLAADHVVDNRASRKSAAVPAMAAVDNNAPSRAISSASKRKKISQAKAHSSFLQLLHLAIYEHALAFAESETEIYFLHLLITKLVQKLGINSVRSGLPMIYQLQDEAKRLPSPAAVILVASLTHCYFMALSHQFDFAHTRLGRDIHDEQSRRASQGVWAKSITFPPIQLGAGADLQSIMSTPRAIGASPGESLRFIESRVDIADAISSGYSQGIMSPPASPSMQPGRPVSRMRSMRSSISTPLPQLHDLVLPQSVKAELMEPWSREACIIAADLDRSRTLSISASRSGSGSGKQSRVSPDGRLAALGNSAAVGASGNGESLPLNFRASTYMHSANHSGRSSLHGAFPGKRHFSAAGAARLQQGSSTGRPVARIDDLRRALSGSYEPSSPSPHVDGLMDDAASDSMISANFTTSELSLVAPEAHGSSTVGMAITAEGHQALPSSLYSQQRQVQTSLATREAEPLQQDTHAPPRLDDDIPPVPMLPANLRSAGPQDLEAKSGTSGEPANDAHDYIGIADSEPAQTQPAQFSVRGSQYGEILPGKVDLRASLAEIGSSGSASGRTQTPEASSGPPY